MTTLRIHRPLARVLLVLGLTLVATPAIAGTRPDSVRANDNRQAAGTRTSGTLSLALRAARGRWQPAGPSGSELTIEALGEVGGTLEVPSPLIRVPEDTMVAVSIANELDVALRVHGLCTRDGRPCPPVEVPRGERREVRFAAGEAGTYH
jgi:hypothetical protein